MKLTINIDDRVLKVFFVLIVLIGVGGVVHSYNPSLGWHSPNQIDWSVPITDSNFITVQTGYGDKISIGGDGAGNDLEIKINAPIGRDRVTFWNDQIGDRADILVEDADISGNSVSYGTAYSGGNADSNKVCNKGGNNCPPGRVLGGGCDGLYGDCIVHWGVGDCSSGSFVCTQGTKRSLNSGVCPVSHPIDAYFCIT